MDAHFPDAFYRNTNCHLIGTKCFSSHPHPTVVVKICWNHSISLWSYQTLVLCRTHTQGLMWQQDWRILQAFNFCVDISMQSWKAIVLYKFILQGLVLWQVWRIILREKEQHRRNLLHVRLTATFIWLQVVKSIPSNVPIKTLLVNLLQIVCCMVSSFNSLQITGIEGSSFLKGLLLGLPSPPPSLFSSLLLKVQIHGLN